MKCIKPTIVWSSLIILITFTSMSMASTAQMKVTLTRINTVLNRINPLINLAEQQQEPNARIQFQFERLREDIAHIQSGIIQAMKPISIQPRQVLPLSGDYLPVSSLVLKKGGERLNKGHLS